MADPRLRQITIKTGVLKRITKEKTVYEREVGEQRARIERLRSEGKDDHVLKKVNNFHYLSDNVLLNSNKIRMILFVLQEDEVLQEAMMMVPDAERRLKKAFDELNDYLKNENELKETKEYGAAAIAIDAANEQIQETWAKKTEKL